MKSLFLSALLFIPLVSFSASNSGYTEKEKSWGTSHLRKLKKSIAEAEEKELSQLGLGQTLKTLFGKFSSRVRVPGFISASPIPQIGRIIGPKPTLPIPLRIGDTVFARWAGAPLPKPGDRYAAYSPAIVLQNLDDPTDFEVFGAPPPTEKLPRDRRLAGYFYEITGRLKVIKIEGGIVRMIIEQMRSDINTQSEIMQMPPLIENITPIQSGIQLSAAVVSGSPVGRLSTTERSFIYLNRGSRDGIRVGRVFESIERIPLDDSVSSAAPELSNGEAVVIHVTDSYATAMITKQFELIRIGSLLRTKQEETPIVRNAPFQNYDDKSSKKESTAPSLPEVPSKEAPPGAMDESLPEPRKRPSPPTLSELDELEQGLKLKSLSPAEKTRLDKLSHQEKIGADKSAELEEEASESGAPPTIENSFKDGKKPGKKASTKTKKKAKNDEEELNLLMMQN